MSRCLGRSSSFSRCLVNPARNRCASQGSYSSSRSSKRDSSFDRAIAEMTPEADEEAEKVMVLKMPADESDGERGH